MFFSPDGLISSSRGLNEFSQANQDGGKIHQMLMFLFEKVLKPHIDTGHELVLFLDNYFTCRKTMKAFRYLGVANTGTARPRRGWPPDNLKIRSNALYN